MEITSHIVTTPPRDASSVVLLRDGAEGLEVFLMRRANESDVLGGAYVFPGGKLDEADALLAHTLQLDHPADQLVARLGEPGLTPETALALYVAAVREAYEECGVLLAHEPPNSPAVDRPQFCAACAGRWCSPDPVRAGAVVALGHTQASLADEQAVRHPVFSGGHAESHSKPCTMTMKPHTASG
jgi:8-oxo-dGTP pyrophosphatase MutT (NUDIX family)